MDSNSPIKSSSRAGRFKKKLVTSDVLKEEAPAMLEKLLLFKEQLNEANFTAAYIILYLAHRYPGSWLGAKKEFIACDGPSWRDLPFVFEPNIIKRLEHINTIQEIFSSFALKATPLSVNRAILEWSRGNYKLELMFRIPGPSEVLKQQMLGHRCVTAITDKRLAEYILGQRDALSFTMHDLIHADHFYRNNECYKGQLGFYGLLDKTISYFDLEHENFATEFEYLISDMNAYAIHLLKCLKSAMVHYFDEEYFLNWIKDLDAPIELKLLNLKDYKPETMDENILNWLDQYRVV